MLYKYLSWLHDMLLCSQASTLPLSIIIVGIGQADFEGVLFLLCMNLAQIYGFHCKPTWQCCNLVKFKLG